MSILDTAKDAYELAKTSATLELREKINALREQAVDLQEENLKLKEENLSLRKKYDTRKDLVYRGSYYFLVCEDGEDGPFCQRCFDSEGKLIRLQGGVNDKWACRECKSAFYGPNFKPPRSNRGPRKAGSWMAS